MIEIVLRKGLKKHIVVIYNDIDQLPIDKFNKVNKYWMLNDEIGSSIQDFDLNHFNKFALLAGDKEKMLAELKNFRILVYNIMNEVNVEHLSFACMVHSIDGKEVTDNSEENLKKILLQLSGLGLSQELLKKKLQKSGNKSMKN